MDLNALTETSYKIACEKGWWDGPPRSLAALTLLMQSENAEALEDFRANKALTEIWYEGEKRKPCGIPVELADTIIRICDFAGHHGIDLEAAYEKTLPPKDGKRGDFEEALARSNYSISMAYGNHEMLRQAESDLLTSAQNFWLAQACRYIIEFCDASGIDLDAAIQIKTEFNRTRPARHGGKRI